MRAIALMVFLIGAWQAATPVRAAGSTAALSVQLSAAAPELEARVLEKALRALQCATRAGAKPAQRLAVIDFSLPSSQARLWLFDLVRGVLVLRDRVAHGENSGYKYARRFSNAEGSYQSSLGLFRTRESYTGRYGYSLRMDGLEPGVNDRARERAIVIHPADYVGDDWVRRNGRIGRSQGCPAVRPEVADRVVDSLKDGQYMFAYYPDPAWLDNSMFLNCERPEVQQQLARLDP